MTPDPGEMFADAPCGYVEVGPDDVIIVANRTFLALVDRSEGEVVGRMTFASLLTAGGRIYHETHYRPMLAMHGEVHEIAFEMLRADGVKVPVLVSSNVKTDAGSGGLTTRTIVFEARDRRTYETELLHARREAEAAEARARLLAHTLQQTFVPPSVPDIPGLEVVGAYRPAGDGSEVGGDFYDVFQIRAGEWVVALGDVCGKGVDAAILTTFVRHSIRAMAVEWDAPSDMLRALNSALLRHDSERFCTVVVVRMLKEDDHWLATISSGGHPLPLLVSPEGEVAEIGAAGSLIGVLTMPQLDDARYTIRTGEGIVLFTDGVTEARREADFFGRDRLVSLVARPMDSAATTTASILDRVLGFQGGDARDDIAILSIRILPFGEAPSTVESLSPVDLEAKNRALLALRDLAD